MMPTIEATAAPTPAPVAAPSKFQAATAAPPASPAPVVASAVVPAVPAREQKARDQLAALRTLKVRRQSGGAHSAAAAAAAATNGAASSDIAHVHSLNCDHDHSAPDIAVAAAAPIPTATTATITEVPARVLVQGPAAVAPTVSSEVESAFAQAQAAADAAMAQSTVDTGKVYECHMTNGRFEVLNDNNPNITDRTKFTGDGRFAYTDGAWYSGAWVDGQKHGKGIMQFPDGTIFDGSFAHDSLNGLAATVRGSVVFLCFYL